VRSQQVGDTILVSWDETIDHLGHYEILFSPSDDTSFSFLTDPAGVTLNNIPDVQGGTLPHHYTQMVKLPPTPCAACTLQLKQYMQGAGYDSCAELELRAAVTSAPDAGTALPDLGPEAVPSSPPAPQPSSPPAPPDMAVARRSSELEIDYSYGCDVSGGAATALFPMLLLLGLAFRRRQENY
jgi:MYXO-CTERM domain-containing protein